jgi:hypothetical protein
MGFLKSEFKTIFLCTMLLMSKASYPSCVSSSSAPTGCSVFQVPNSQSFTVTWTAGSGNGGAGGCKLQYNNGAIWVDVGGTEDCDANATGAARTLPADGWIASWISAPIRLIRVSDSANMCGGSSIGNVTCSSAPVGSATPTPTFDENCNGLWDDTGPGKTIVVAPLESGLPINLGGSGCPYANAYDYGNDRWCVDNGYVSSSGATGTAYVGALRFCCNGPPTSACVWETLGAGTITNSLTCNDSSTDYY